MRVSPRFRVSSPEPVPQRPALLRPVCGHPKTRPPHPGRVLERRFSAWLAARSRGASAVPAALGLAALQTRAPPARPGPEMQRSNCAEPLVQPGWRAHARSPGARANAPSYMEGGDRQRPNYGRPAAYTATPRPRPEAPSACKDTPDVLAAARARGCPQSLPWVLSCSSSTSEGLSVFSHVLLRPGLPVASEIGPQWTA